MHATRDRPTRVRARRRSIQRRRAPARHRTVPRPTAWGARASTKQSTPAPRPRNRSLSGAAAVLSALSLSLSRSFTCALCLSSLALSLSLSLTHMRAPTLSHTHIYGLSLSLAVRPSSARRSCALVPRSAAVAVRTYLHTAAMPLQRREPRALQPRLRWLTAEIGCMLQAVRGYNDLMLVLNLLHHATTNTRGK